MNSMLLVIGGLAAVGATALLVASQWGLGGIGSRASREEAPPEPQPVPRGEPEFDVPDANARVMDMLSGRTELGPEFQGLLRRLGAERVEPEAKRQLLDLMLTLDPEGRRLVGQALGLLTGDEETARALLRLCARDAIDIQTARVIFEALEKMQVPELLPDLLAMLDTDTPYQVLVVGVIGSTCGQAGGEALVLRLRGKIRPESRQAIVDTLAKHPDPQVMLEVADAIARARPEARQSLIEVLGRTRDVRFVDELSALYPDEPDEEVRLKILRALGRIGDRDAALFLLDRSNRDGPQAAFAATALREIRRPDALEALAAKWDILNSTVRAAVMESSARLPNPTPKLVAAATIAIRDPDEQTRIGAARVLGRPEQEEHIAFLVDFLKRSTGARACGIGLDSLLRIGTPKAAEAVMVNLQMLPEDAAKVYRMRAERTLARKPD